MRRFILTLALIGISPQLSYAAEGKKPQIQDSEEARKQRGDKLIAESLVKAAGREDTKTLKLLLEAKADPNIPFKKYFALRLASEKYKTETLILLLEHNANPNLNLEGRFNPLHAAINSLIPDNVKILLEHKANPNQTGGQHDDTPLTLAAFQFNGAKDICRTIITTLLEHNANPLITNSDGKMASDYVKDHQNIKDMLAIAILIQRQRLRLQAPALPAPAQEEEKKIQIDENPPPAYGEN